MLQISTLKKTHSSISWNSTRRNRPRSGHHPTNIHQICISQDLSGPLYYCSISHSHATFLIVQDRNLFRYLYRL